MQHESESDKCADTQVTDLGVSLFEHRGVLSRFTSKTKAVARESCPPLLENRRMLAGTGDAPEASVYSVYLRRAVALALRILQAFIHCVGTQDGAVIAVAHCSLRGCE